uniref:Uncharacterized protein n=1 Tax=Monopterus albus TaxID=43700 RepID=A0A3Q3QK62_MONAL
MLSFFSGRLFKSNLCQKHNPVAETCEHSATFVIPPSAQTGRKGLFSNHGRTNRRISLLHPAAACSHTVPSSPNEYQKTGFPFLNRHAKPTDTHTVFMHTHAEIPHPAALRCQLFLTGSAGSRGQLSDSTGGG